MNYLKNIFINVRAAIRFVCFVSIVLTYLLVGFIYFITTSDPLKRREKLLGNAQFFSKVMATAFNMKIVCHNNIPADENSLIVGNHIGFIDIVALQSLRGCVFITSTDMKNTPGLGQICDLAGCTYVNRRSRMNIHEELKGVVEVLKQGVRVVLYPESVASNGEQVLPFKKTLLMSAGFAEKPIRPFVFNFREVNGGPVQFKHRDSLCWYGDETFLPAIWRSLKLNSITVEIEFLPLVYTKAEDDRTVIAKQLHQMISEKYIPFKPENSPAVEKKELNLSADLA